MKEVRRGDVFLANLDPVKGSEQGGLRPCVVLQNDVGNKYSPTVILAPITSRLKKRDMPTHVLIPHLTLRDDPAAIPTDDFDREGRHYTLLDVLKNDLTESDVKDYAEVITLESATKDVGEIIKVLEPELEVVTEDGYSGILRSTFPLCLPSA